METKICGKCKREKPISDFYKSKRDRYRSRCKACGKEDNREYAKTGYYQRYFQKYSKRPYARSKYLARQYKHTALQSGKIEKQPCAICGQEQVQGHHLDYNKPLLIVWLCPKCHRELHELIKS